MSSLILAVECVYTSRYALLLLAISYFGYIQWTSYRRLRQFNGPFLAKFTNLYMTQLLGRQKVNEDLYAVSETYGDLARVGPNILLTNDPELVARMSAARSRYTKSPWYSANKLEIDHDSCFSMVNEKLHTARRAQLIAGYAGKGVDDVETIVDRHLLELVKLITEKYISDDLELRPMDLARKSSYLALDIITEAAYGRAWGCLVEDCDVNEWFSSMDQTLPIANAMNTLPWLAYVLSIPVIAKLIMPSEKDQKGPGRLIGITRKIVGDRFKQTDPTAQTDMLAAFLRNGLLQDEAVAEVFIQILAGSDTSATNIRSTMLFIIANARVYKTLQAEIDSHITRGSIIADEEAKTLPYLQAVIKEGARMFSVTTGLLTKLAPPEGDTFKGIFIPGGTEIGQNNWHIHRSKKVYGEDSAIFRPERWLQAKGETLETMERTLSLSWGHGRYQCLGKGLAMMELNKTYFTLLKKFDFELCDPMNPWVSVNYGLWMQKDMFVRITLRSAE